ncbi:hypothetical protein HO133_004992 [Letharia lupina]|uniref:Fucose-specific lectin n=1 Tax=Letharia lupina TaxID=560253 RepID=A0A8H6C918_9LECA|nr:uncharacterized protein HO133_004992 [Letharia lupina]KAF6219167.1 hypothetical protein HO133_004992 [Letharia lupina]
MTTRSSVNKEKSPIDKVDYEGLQLDTRARDNRDPHLDDSKPQGLLDDDFNHHGFYLNEKQAHAGVPVGIPMGIPTSPEGTLSPMSPMGPKEMDEGLGSPPPPEKRTCGLRQKHFWELLGLILAIVLAAAVISGVVGGLQSRSGRSSSSGQPASNVSTNDTTHSANNTTSLHLQQGDIVAGSPLNVISYNQGGSSAESQQAFRIYYQSALGNIKEAVSNGLMSWQSALPIFTDAINNTGLATVTYLNGSNQQGSIFYVGLNGLLQEKRKVFSSTAYWEPGTLNNMNIAAVANLSLPSVTQDPKNDWDGYRMAAVYSENFNTGPGLRLYYHAENLTGAAYVQELIWTQSNDSWADGAKLHNPWPNSHLAATIDESTQILRLFFSSGNNTLQEAWMSLLDPTGTYKNGISFPNLLDYNNADIAAISQNGSTYVYHYSSASQTAPPTIHELVITGTPGSINNQEAYNLSSPLVASPNLATNQAGEVSLYRPLAASNNIVQGLPGQIYVFWADKITGDPLDSMSLSGFGELLEISRPVANSTWPASTGQIPIPLGSSNSQPNQKRTYRMIGRRPWFA